MSPSDIACEWQRLIGEYQRSVPHPLNMVNLAIVLCLPWNTGKVPVTAQYIGGTKGGDFASILTVCLGKQILGKERVPREQGKRRGSC